MVEIHNLRRISALTVHARLAFVGGYDYAHREVVLFLDFVMTRAAPSVVLLRFPCCLFPPPFCARRKICPAFLPAPRADHSDFPTLKPRV
jgi:hypothetical protein